MRILVVSDTHGKDENLECVLDKVRPIDILVHCGDIEGREDFIEAVAECPVYMVRGNNDFFSTLPGEVTFFLGNRRCFLTHGHSYRVSLDTGIIAEEGRARGADIVFFGHSHRPVFEMDRVLLVNPGSLSYPRQEGRHPSYILMDIEEDSVRGKICYLDS